MMTVEQLTETIILTGPKCNVWQAPRCNLVIDHDRPTEVIFKRFHDARIEQSITGSFSQLIAGYSNHVVVDGYGLGA